jgi:IS30 family transposase
MSQLTQEERCQIFGYKESGFSIRAIAKMLNRSHTTILRELARNSQERIYKPYQAHQASLQRKRCASMRSTAAKTTSKDLAILWLKDCQASPEQISGRLVLEGKPSLSYETIYQIVWKDKRAGGELYKHLRHQGKRYNKRSHKNSGRGVIPNRVDISERPQIVEKKERIGDWEGDTVIGGQHQGVLLTLVDRASKYVIIQELASKEAEPVTNAIIQRLGELDMPVHSLTFDNGKEFSGHQKIAEQLKTSCFFARPYHSWERGLNEHTNGLIRQYYPKGYNFATIMPEEVQHVQDLLNNRPRKSLGFKTPHEVFCEGILRQAA